MYIKKTRSLGFVTTTLMFSEAEKKTLLAVSLIAEKAREMCGAQDPEWEMHDHDLLLAEVEHGCRDAAQNLEIADEPLDHGFSMGFA